MRRNRALMLLVVAGAVFAMGLATLLWMLGAGSSAAQQGVMHNCPLEGKWAISVWDGPDGTDTGQALATCGAGAAVAAYYIDPSTQSWLRYFVGRAEVSNLLTLDNHQGVVAIGGPGAPATPTPSPTPTRTPTRTPTTSPTSTPTPTPTPTPEPTAARTVYYDLTMLASPPEGGTTVPSLGTHSYARGTTVHVSAIANTDWWFRNWGGDCPSDDTYITVHMNADKTCIANFAACPSVIPGTYNGQVVLNGAPAPDDTLVEAFVGGLKWGEDRTFGGRYVVDVPSSSPLYPPCFEGGEITFNANEAICEQLPLWESGLHDLDLTCTSE